MGEEQRGTVTKDLSAALRKATHHPDGWWVEAVLGNFHFLETDFRYRLEDVHLHFRGDFISYDGPVYQLSISYNNEEAGDLAAHLLVLEDIARGARVRWLPVWKLLEALAPGLDWRPPNATGPLSRAEVKATLERWASGLRTYAPEILRGAWADVPGWEYMW